MNGGLSSVGSRRLSIKLLRGGKSMTSLNISNIFLELVGLDISTLHMGNGKDKSRAARIPWSPADEINQRLIITRSTILQGLEVLVWPY